MQNLSDDQLKRQDFVGRQVPRPANSGIGGVPCPQAGRKVHNMNDHTLPGSVALIWAGSFK